MSIRSVLKLTALVGVMACMFWACSTQADEGFTQLRWPPDTIFVTHVEGDIYEVKAVPSVADPLMKVAFSWSPGEPWPPDTMLITWPPDTTD